MESKALTPCYWMVSRASPLWSLGLATHGLKNRRLNYEKGRGFLSLTELMPATRLLGAKRSAHHKYTPAKSEQVRSRYLWQHVLYVYHWSNKCVESTEKKHSRSPGLVHPRHSDAQVGADCGRNKSDPHVQGQPPARWSLRCAVRDAAPIWMT